MDIKVVFHINIKTMYFVLLEPLDFLVKQQKWLIFAYLIKQSTFSYEALSKDLLNSTELQCLLVCIVTIETRMKFQKETFKVSMHVMCL